MGFFQKIWKYCVAHWLPGIVYGLPLLLLMVLLARNPFSQRTLIPNFEPFPDAFHYVTTPRCWLSGQGWNICREGGLVIRPGVPPLYSVLMIPFFVIRNDPRMFYFLNLSLSVVSFVMLAVIVKNLKLAKLFRFTVLILFATNYYTFWFPSLAMAEQLLVPWFLLSLWLVSSRVSLKKAVLAGVVAVGFYLIKYSAAPLVVVFGTLYFIKICTSYLRKSEGKDWLTQGKKTLANKEFWLLITSYLFTGVMVVMIGVGPRIFDSLIQISRSLLPQPVEPATGVTSARAAVSWAFSVGHFSKHFPQFFSVLFGKPVRFLWSALPLIPGWLGVIGVLGLVWGSVKAKSRWLTVCCLLCVIAQLIFMSVFYVVDARYVIIFLPAMLIGAGLFMGNLGEVMTQKKLFNLFQVAVVGAVSLYLVSQASLLKHTILVNLKYAETPWWYLASRSADAYLTVEYPEGERPVLITAIPPHLYDFYTSGRVQLLPLSHDHDFRGDRKNLWGDHDYEDLPALYASFLQDGRAVYVTNYGIGNEAPRHADLQNLKDNFQLELIKEDCHGACNLWRVR